MSGSRANIMIRLPVAAGDSTVAGAAVPGPPRSTGLCQVVPPAATWVINAIVPVFARR